MEGTAVVCALPPDQVSPNWRVQKSANCGAHALLLSASVIVFLIGLVSEQITALTYRRDA